MYISKYVYIYIPVWRGVIWKAVFLCLFNDPNNIPDNLIIITLMPDACYLSLYIHAGTVTCGELNEAFGLNITLSEETVFSFQDLLTFKFPSASPAHIQQLCVYIHTYIPPAYLFADINLSLSLCVCVC